MTDTREECERLRGQVAEQDRRIEDLRVSLIRAINTALSRAGVELPTSAAATVAECLHADNLDRLSELARAPDASAAATVEPSFESDLPPGLDRLLAELADWKSRAETAQRETELETAHGRQTAATINAAFAREKQRADKAEKALAEARALTAAEKTRADQNYADWKNVRAAVKALEDWRADVTVALQRPGGALFADVPKHVRDLVRERNNLQRQLDAGQPRIATRCPACGGSTLFVGHGGHLTCSRLECPNPSVADEIKRIADQLAEATEWRPMREHIAAPTIVAWRGEGGRVGVYGACNFGPLPKHQQTDALGWLPIPPYRAKEGQ